MVDAEAIAEERFNVYLMSGGSSVSVAVEMDEEIMRLVDQQ